MSQPAMNALPSALTHLTRRRFPSQDLQEQLSEAESKIATLEREKESLAAQVSNLQQQFNAETERYVQLKAAETEHRIQLEDLKTPTDASIASLTSQLSDAELERSPPTALAESQAQGLEVSARTQQHEVDVWEAKHQATQQRLRELHFGNQKLAAGTSALACEVRASVDSVTRRVYYDDRAFASTDLRQQGVGSGLGWTKALEFQSEPEGSHRLCPPLAFVGI